MGNTLTPVITRDHYDPTTYHLTQTVSGEGGVTTYGHDGHHAVLTTTQRLAPAGSMYQWRGSITAYDAYGERTARTDGRGVSVSADGVAGLSGSAGTYTSHWSYDAQGDQVNASTPPLTTTPNGVSTASTPVTTTSGSDGDGDQTSLISANGQTTAYSYDHPGRRVQTSLPAVSLWDGTTVTPTLATGYDGEGNVVRQVDGTGSVTQSSYDPLGRLVATTNPVGATTLVTYTATEKAATQDARGHVISYGYDTAGRPLQATDPLSGTSQYQYDAVGNTTAITQDTSSSVTSVETRGYNALHEVVSDTVGGPGTPGQTTQTAYDHDGHVTQVQQPSGDLTTTSYNLADQVTTVQVSPASGARSSQETYRYDNAANQIESIDFHGRDHRTTFDGANRAVQSTDSYTGTTTLTTTTSFDPDGNTVSQSTQTVNGAGQPQTAAYTTTYNAADWPISRTDVLSSGQQLSTAYGYDGAGQQRTQTILNGVTPITNTLNAEGLVTATSESLGGTPYTSAFAYNANDLPLTTTLPGGVQQTRQHDANNRLSHIDAGGPSGVSTPLSSS